MNEDKNVESYEYELLLMYRMRNVLKQNEEKDIADKKKTILKSAKNKVFRAISKGLAQN